MLETVKAFSALSEEFVELFMRHEPVKATGWGIHDYDHVLPNDSPEGIRERVVWLRDLEQRLVASVPWQELPVEHRIDYAQLRAKIAAQRSDLEEIKNHQKNPAIYPKVALEAIQLLAARPFAPLEDRKEAILARMTAVPEYLEAVRPNLQQVPEIYFGLASDINLSGPLFVEEVMRTLVRSFPGEAERIEHAAERARLGFIAYQDFLDQEIEKKVGGTFAIGERWMNFKLEREHLLDVDCAGLEDLGRDQIEGTKRLLQEEAKKIDPARTWQELVVEAKKRHPEALRLRDAYLAEVDRARRFIEEHAIAPLPPGEKLEVVDTPVYDRPTTPLTAYLPPAPFDEDQTGFLYVTPVDGKGRKEDQELQLQGHNYAALPLTTLHETFPGHHLQRCTANRTVTRLRKLADSDIFREGWAHYCEDLMYEAGFFLDPMTRILQLRDLLWRACRVVIDIGLHTGRMTFMQAVDYLIENSMMERFSALMEVKRYTMTPTQPMSYLVGKIEILSIRDEAMQRLGSRFDLYEFHAQLLASGSLQPTLVREELWNRLK